MSTDLVMPRLGATMTEGTIVRWLKAPGAAVAEGEPVVVIETDKSTVELTAPTAGVLGPWLVAEGATVAIGAPLIVVASAGKAISTAASLPATPDRERKASPVARRMAQEHGIDLAKVNGSGPGGRIVEADVLAAVEARRSSPPPLAGAPAASQDENGSLETLTTLRRTVAERMAHSFSTAPHFYLQVEVDASALVAWHQHAGTRNPTLTYTDFLLFLTALGLREIPRANSAWVAGRVRHPDSIHLGLAVASDKGLVVPVIHDAGRLSLADLARRRAELVARARTGKLLPDDYAGGTFTLSNLGMFRVDSFQAILNPPQAAILAAGQIKDRPIVVGGQLSVRPTLHLTLSADHRVLDGAEAARFLGRLAELIEAPQQLAG